MNTLDLLAGSLSLRLAITLLHFLWQGLAVAILAWVASRWLASAGARVRYAIHVAALLLMAACVPVTFALVDVSWARHLLHRDQHVGADQKTAAHAQRQHLFSSAGRLPATDEIESSELLDQVLNIDRRPPWEFDQLDELEEALEATRSAVDASRNDSRRDSRAGLVSVSGHAYLRALWSRLAPFAPYLACAYLLGVLAMLFRLAIGLRGGECLRRNSALVTDARLLTMIRHQARRMRLRCAPAVAYCERISVPVVVGVLQPMILLPASLVSGLAPDQLQALILHELAHIRRHDTLVNLLQRLIESLLFFHPAVWLVSRRVSRERELVADDLVLAAGWDRTRYADALVRMAELSASLQDRTLTGEFAVAASGRHGSDFQRRVLRLLQPADASRVRLTRVSLVTVALVATSLLAAPALVAWAILPQSRASAVQVEAESAERLQATRPGEPEELPSDPKNKASDQQPAEAEGGSRVDGYGDPLPDGAIMRLGTVQSRSTNQFADGNLAFVPGQALLVARGRSGGVGIWDPETGKMLKERTISDSFIRDVEVTPDGSHVAILATQSRPERREHDTRMEWWNVATGEVTREMHWNEPTSQRSRRIAFTSDGLTLAIGTRDGRVRILDLATGDELNTHPTVDGEIESLAFSRDGQWLAVAGRRGVALWEWMEGVEPHQLFSSSMGDRGALAVAFSPDGKWLATSSDERAGVRVWDTSTRQLVWRVDVSTKAYHFAERIAFSSDSRLLIVSAGHNGEHVQLRDAATGKLVRTLNAQGKSLRYVAISSDDEWVAGFDKEGTIHLWRLADSEPQYARLVGYDEPVGHLAFTPDGQTLVAAPHRGAMVLWDTNRGEKVRQIQRDDQGTLARLGLSPSGKLAAGIAFDDSVRLWELDSGRELYELPGHDRMGRFTAYAVAFTPDNHRCLSFGGDMYLRIWDVRTGKAIAEHDLWPDHVELDRVSSGQPRVLPGMFGSAIPPPVYTTFSPDGRSLFFVYAGTVKTFDTETGELFRSLDVEQVKSIDVSPDGTQFVLLEHRAGADGRSLTTVVTLRDSTSNEVVREIKPRSGVAFTGMVQFAPRGDRLAISTYHRVTQGGFPYFVELYDVRSGRVTAKLNMPLRPDKLAFSPEGSQLAASYTDGTILIWAVEQGLQTPE